MSKGFFLQNFTNKKMFWMIFVAGSLIISSIGLMFLAFRDFGDENSFGIISDIHAGKEKKYVRDESNIVFPARYEECLGLEIKKFPRRKRWLILKRRAISCLDTPQHIMSSAIMIF